MKSVKQVGALCYRRTRRGTLRLLLVTSRDTGRWIIPKGWPEKHLTDRRAAAQEAIEEAGAKGRIGRRPVGRYRFRRVEAGRGQKLKVSVFLLAVGELRRTWPEQKQRKRRWFSVEGAAGRVAEPELKALIRGLGGRKALPKEKKLVRAKKAKRVRR